jgi:hypothetical protein
VPLKPLVSNPMFPIVRQGFCVPALRGYGFDHGSSPEV